MGWYYEKENEKIGPISQEQVETLIKNGIISPQTRIWNDITKEWKTFEDVKKAMEEPIEPVQKPTKENPTEEIILDTPQQKIICDQCGLAFPPDEVIEIGERVLCGNCKTIYLQGIREGFSMGSKLPYGGFWTRYLAKLIDGIILTIVYFILVFIVGIFSGPIFNQNGLTGAYFTVLFIYTAISFAYYIFFVGKYGATIGKMVLGLEIVLADQSAMDYKIATYRILSEMVSGMTMNIGYLMAAFDEEKRTLHDRICNTRVIYR